MSSRPVANVLFRSRRREFEYLAAHAFKQIAGAVKRQLSHIRSLGKKRSDRSPGV